jgi:2-oxoglutarate/2-oxoacid ferredoxin oxidoreductase subunit alpha
MRPGRSAPETKVIERTIETMSETVTPAPAVAKPRRTLTRAVIRFAGDSGDGMQVTGEQFTTEAAWAGNDISTLPNFPAEIRAPAGTLFGVSSFQLQFGSQRVYTPGDQLDTLVAMNPAALKVHLGDLKPGGILIVNTAAFDQRNLEKAGYPKDDKGEPKSPLNDPGLAEKFRLYQVDISGMTKKCLEDLPLNAKEKERCKNFFALGLVSWIYTRPLDPTLDAIKKRFAKNPTFVEANIRVLKAGHAFGETAEMFSEHYGIEAAEMPPGVYRSMTGNRALAWGLLAAAERTQIPIVFGAYPITPASSILEELALHKRWRVRTFQAEDEIAAVTSAIGASFGGALGVTASSGPGIALKGEGIGLAVMAELPLVIFDIQRGGPSTGLPTKTEQADLMQALYGRNSESPIVVIAPCTPGDCFYIAYEAVRIAIKYMVPVMVLSDGYLANGSEPWLIPDPKSLPDIPVSFRTEKEGFQAYLRDAATLARPWVRPGTPGLEHRIGGIEKQDGTGNISYEPDNHDHMVRTRAEKVRRVAQEIPATVVNGPESGDVLVVGWGGTYGAITAAVEEAQMEGKSVASAHIRHLNPLPPDLGQILRQYRRVLVPEINSGQLVRVLRAEYLVDAVGFNRVRGMPLASQEILEAIHQLLEAKS